MRQPITIKGNVNYLSTNNGFINMVDDAKIGQKYNYPNRKLGENAECNKRK